MAFGIDRHQLAEWKEAVSRGEIAFLTHYWLHPRFPACRTVTKAGCRDVDKLLAWGSGYGLKSEWLHDREGYPHFDLLGDLQREILYREGQWRQIRRFGIEKPDRGGRT